jgi:hypothetical protein
VARFCAPAAAREDGAASGERHRRCALDAVAHPHVDAPGRRPVPLRHLHPIHGGGSVLFTWIYQGTRGSLLLAVLTHVGTHLNNPGHAMPERVVPMIHHAAAYVALALVLVLRDRRAWFGSPGRADAPEIAT